MLRRIDLFMPPNLSQYGVLHHFTKKFHEALQRLGVESRILEAQYDNPKPFLTELFKDVPDCTLSFNGLLPDSEGRFFCDMVRIPHVACIVDSPNDFVQLAQSPYTVITSVDRDACDFFKGVHCKNVIFMPHGVEKNISFVESDEHRPYDVAMLASCIDYEALHQQWKKKYSADLIKVLEEAAEETLSDPIKPYVTAFVGCFEKYVSAKGTDTSKINFLELLSDLELYIRGKARLGLLKSIQDARVDIFGAPSATSNWKKLLGNVRSNYVFHEAVPYDQALEIMHKSKIILNSCAWIKNGTHERTLAGMAAGALVVTEGNAYMRGQFIDGTNVVFYRYANLENVNGQINTYLADEPRRKRVAEAGRLQVLHHHTWDQRAGLLLRELDPILNGLREGIEKKA